MRSVALILLCLALTACDSTQRGYAKFDLPNGDSIIIDRVEDHWDVPVAQHYYRVRSKRFSMPDNRVTICSSMNDQKPEFKLIGPGSDSVVAIVSAEFPTNAAVIFDFRDGAVVPYKYFPDDVAARSDDPRFPALEAAHRARVQVLLARLAKATGSAVVFGDGYTGQTIEAQP